MENRKTCQSFIRHIEAVSQRTSIKRLQKCTEQQLKAKKSEKTKSTSHSS